MTETIGQMKDTAGQEALVKLLRAHPLCSGLGARALTRIAGMTEVLTAAPGTRLFAQNDAGDGLYLVERGCVALMARAPGDGLVELERAGPGSVFGEFCLLDGGRRSAEAHVLEPAQLHRLDRHQFDTAIQVLHSGALEIRQRLMCEVARRSRATIAALSACPLGLFEERAPMAAPEAEPVASTADPQGMLGGFPGFDTISARDWTVLAAGLRARQVPRGTCVAEPDQPRDTLLIVGRGALRTGLAVGDKMRQILLHGPGAIANTATFTDMAPCPAHVEARENTLLFELPRARVEELAGTTLGEALTRCIGVQMTRDMRHLSREMARLTCPPVKDGNP